MNSVLDRAGPVVMDPFPHVVVDDALPVDLYDELCRTFPEDRLLRKASGENKRVDIHVKESLAEPLPEPWMGFVKQHTSIALWLDVWAKFGSTITENYPWIKVTSPTARRGVDRGEILLDCQPGLNTPTTTRSRVIGPHLDNPSELFAGLLYMGDSDGDLLLYKQVQPLRYRHKREVFDECVEQVGEIKYGPNRLVFFLNVPWALHGVSPRGPDPRCRRLLNFLGDYHRPLFQLP